ncbi:MAG: hypothetical protein HY661_12415 [Betaproteobacteria bacterium]|nr:hypothetical protein [Betaproteobacteria bacterium]
MNRKQFFILLAALVLLVAAGAGVIFSERSAWKSADSRIGQKLVAGLTIAEVAEILIQEPGTALTLKKQAEGWRVLQPVDSPADVERIGNLLLKLQEIKVVQTEAVPESLRAALQLKEPKEAQEPGAGTRLELKDAGGKVLARLLLGKKVLKPREGAPAGVEGTPAGRYILVGSEQANAVIISDPLLQVEAKPDAWIARAQASPAPESPKPELKKG